MSLTWREQQLIQDIEDGIGSAVSELGFSKSDLTSIKMNKLVYIAIQEFYDETPLTYSWFKYGPSVGHRHVSEESVPVQPLSRISGRGSRVGNGEEYRTPEEYAYLFMRDIDFIEDLLSDSTKSYLKPFYQEYAKKEHSEFEDLYVSSADLQVKLDKISSDGKSAYRDIYDEIDEPLQEVGSEILSNSVIDEAVDPFIKYADLLRDVLLTCETEFDELSDSEQQMLEQLIFFYYSHSWRYPTLLISEKTAIGPSRRDLVKATINDIDSIARTYTNDFLELRSRLEKSGLLSNQFIKGDDLERDLIEGYKQLGDEIEQEVDDWEVASSEASGHL